LESNSALQSCGVGLVQFSDGLGKQDLQALVEDTEISVLQCVRPVKEHVWELLDKDFFAHRPDVQLRVYGHYGMICDLAFTRKLKNVRHFAADCLKRATNVECIGEMPLLESLSLGVFELEDFRLLELLPCSLSRLSLGATHSKKPSIAHLSRFRELKQLYLESQQKHIEVLAELRNLERLTLRGIRLNDFYYLTNLENLLSLSLTLGSIRSFAGIEDKKCIKHLEVRQARDCRQIEIIQALPGLQNLFLQSLPHIEVIPDLRRATNLRRVVIESLKRLKQFDGLEFAPSLEEFELIAGLWQTPAQLLPVLRNPAVRRCCGGFGSTRKNQEFDRLTVAHGKAVCLKRLPFQYSESGI
jgi:hypothetical protein